MRTLLAAGDVQLLTSSDPETLAPLFELYRSVEAHSWKARSDVAFAGRNRWIEYYRGLMDVGQPMRVAIHVLLLDGVPIAGLITGAFVNHPVSRIPMVIRNAVEKATRKNEVAERNVGRRKPMSDHPLLAIEPSRHRGARTWRLPRARGNRTHGTR